MLATLEAMKNRVQEPAFSENSHTYRMVPKPRCHLCTAVLHLKAKSKRYNRKIREGSPEEAPLNRDWRNGYSRNRESCP